MRRAEPGEPSRFFLESAERLREAGRSGPVLDLACGRGRHALASAALGCRAVAVDRSREALAALGEAAAARRLHVDRVRADLETEHGTPFAPGVFGAVLVFRFLFRPLSGAIVDALRPGGLLIYETFTQRQRNLPYGPGNPAFLLAEGELPKLFPELEVVVYREGLVEGGRSDRQPEHLAQLVARKPARAD